eukprot:365351-Chlamydomonas_euryale.AAC.8
MCSPAPDSIAQQRCPCTCTWHADACSGLDCTAALPLHLRLHLACGHLLRTRLHSSIALAPALALGMWTPALDSVAQQPDWQQTADPVTPEPVCRLRGCRLQDARSRALASLNPSPDQGASLKCDALSRPLAECPLGKAAPPRQGGPLATDKCADICTFETPRGQEQLQAHPHCSCSTDRNKVAACGLYWQSRSRNKSSVTAAGAERVPRRDHVNRLQAFQVARASGPKLACSGAGARRCAKQPAHASELCPPLRNPTRARRALYMLCVTGHALRIQLGGNPSHCWATSFVAGQRQLLLGNVICCWAGCLPRSTAALLATSQLRTSPPLDQVLQGTTLQSAPQLRFTRLAYPVRRHLTRSMTASSSGFFL